MKHRKRSTWGVAALLGLLAASPLRGQSAASEEDLPRGFRFGLSVNAVHLAVTVVDGRGRLVSDLKREDFRVLEDGVPQAIHYFARGTDAPVDVMILVDASGSMELVSKVANARNAAIQLIHALSPEDRVAVYAFDKRLSKVTSFTEDKTRAIEAIEALEPFGATALYDAVANASAAIEHEGFGRRAIVVLTDGIDTASEITIEQAVEAAKSVDLPVYAIRVLSPLDDPKSDVFLRVHGREAEQDALDRFTRETGGRVFQGSEIGALRVAALRIRQELKTQYRLGYTPRNQSGEAHRFRRIEVQTRRRGVEVRTRKGYYPSERGADEDRSRSAILNVDSES